ncbi:hypothetical protein GSUB_04005 [Geoalkalibacter subterraneus]|uniref:Outer membrane lipoprotein BamD-like domain-containing protein n=2 Tax=Geoalkalibacter subterraneus TaxID=483547 RepID=A0A0B5FML5_9BACT|nr:hypothetical protein GSUB_04005 [Geoalkalibacter subterraneus]
MRFMLKRFFLLTFILALSACAPSPDTDNLGGVQKHFTEGESYFERGLYDEAIASWEKVRDSYYSPELNILAEIKIADAYFEAERYVEAAVAYEDFLKQHPDHPRNADVLYQLGLTYYRQILSVDRDQTATRNALATFEILLEKYPEDPRREEVGALIQRCRDHLAAHELYVGRFYLRTGHPKAAAQRLEYLFETYPNFFERDEAYFYLGRAYLELGNRDKAVDAFNTLMKEFPKSEYIPKAQKIVAKAF